MLQIHPGNRSNHALGDRLQAAPPIGILDQGNRESVISLGPDAVGKGGLLALGHTMHAQLKVVGGEAGATRIVGVQQVPTLQ